MKIFIVLILILGLALIGCDDSSDSSGTVGPPPEWPDDNDSTLT